MKQSVTQTKASFFQNSADNNTTQTKIITDFYSKQMNILQRGTELGQKRKVTNTSQVNCNFRFPIRTEFVGL